MNSHMILAREFSRCLHENDRDGFLRLLNSDFPPLLILRGMRKAAQHNHWDFLKILSQSERVFQCSFDDIRDTVECVVLNAVDDHQIEGIKSMLPLIEAQGLQFVAQEALHRCVMGHHPNILDVVELLFPYADMTHREYLLEISVRRHWLPLLEFFSTSLSWELSARHNLSSETHIIDIFPYLKMAVRSYSSFEQRSNTQQDVLTILLRNADANVLADRLDLDAKNEAENETYYSDYHMLYTWVQRQRLAADVETIGERSVCSLKRKL